MYLKTRGLVLRVTDYNDRDSLLTLLTPNNGKLTVKARGLRRKNSPLTAPCQLLAYGEFLLFENRGSYTVNEAASVELFLQLRRDLQKLSLGTYFAQVTDVLSQEDMPNPELLSLVLNCLHMLTLNVSETKIKAVFELRAACLAGYMPDLNGCHVCGSGGADYIDLSAGVLECGRCHGLELNGIRLPVSAGVVQAMQYISSCSAKRLFSFDLGDENILQLSQTTEAYLSTQLERGFSTLDFYKSLLI